MTGVQTAKAAGVFESASTSTIYLQTACSFRLLTFPARWSLDPGLLSAWRVLKVPTRLFGAQVAPMLAHQFIGQIVENGLHEVVLGNCGTIVFSRVGRKMRGLSLGRSVRRRASCSRFPAGMPFCGRCATEPTIARAAGAPFGTTHGRDCEYKGEFRASSIARGAQTLLEVGEVEMN